MELRQGHAMASHFNQRTHYGTHHVAKETVGSDLKTPLCGRQLVPLGMGEMADGGLDVGTCLAESSEVVLAEQPLGSLVHEREVQVVVCFPRAIVQERVLGRMKIIVICTRGGTEAGMHVGIHQLDFLDSNVVGQDPVQAIGHLTGIEHTGISTERRTTIIRAWTPASVRPAPTTSMG